MRWQVVWLLAGLAGCTPVAGLKVVDSVAALPSAQVADYFRLDGRISVRTPGRTLSGSASWTRTAGAETLLLSGPLGQGAAEITRGGDGAILHLSDGRQVVADSDERLMERVLGLRLSLDGLADWLSGRPRVEDGFKGGLGADGRIDWLDQDGWHIEYSQYHDWNGRWLPGRIVARRGDDVEFRFVLDHWEAL
jgi:outer membrane lipoprotein LolB